MATYRLEREKALLLVIDIQERLLPAVRQKKQVVHNTAILAKSAEALGIPALVTEQYPKGLGPTVEEIRSLLPKAKVLQKITFSACTPELLKELETSERSQMIVVGMETHVCVFQTVRGLLESGYEVFVASDAVTSRTKENYENGLELMRDLGAVISNTETIFFDLLKEAATPEFRQLAPLIK